MTKLFWGQALPDYELGVDRGVLYLDDCAHPWNGLVSVEELESGGIDKEHYFDGNRLHISQELGTYSAEVTAYTYPEVFSEYNGYSEKATYKRFGFSYRTKSAKKYRIHLVYNALVQDDDRSWSTLASITTPSMFRWRIHGSDISVPGASPSSHLVLEISNDDILLEVEDILYGTDLVDPRLPLPEEIVEFYESRTSLRITYLGDGRYSAEGPDSVVQVLSDGRFKIDSPTVFFLDDDRFVVDSY